MTTQAAAQPPGGVEPRPAGPTAEDFERVQQSEEFAELRHSHRSFAFPLTVAFIAWYLLYVLLSNYAGGFMGTKLFGNINVALVLGLAQFATTFLIAWLYSRHARRRARPQGRRHQGPDGGRGMSTPLHLTVAAGATEHRPLIITLFGLFVVATLVITVWAGRQTKDAADFYAGGRQFTGFQNGLAISGDYMSAASFLGIAGAIALFGYDGFSTPSASSWPGWVALLLVAEPLRNSGRYTMGDVLAYRMRQRPVRTAAGTSTIVVSIFYLLAQMAGAGVLVSLLLGITSDGGKVAVVALVGLLMILYVTIGGMKGTTWVQMVKAVLLIAGALLITFLVLLKFHFNISELLGKAAENSGKGAKFLEPGLKYGTNGTTKLDFISLGIALVLGTAGLPHILIRFYTVPTAKAARKSVNWAIGIIGAFYLMTIALGFAPRPCSTGPTSSPPTKRATPRPRCSPRRSAAVPAPPAAPSCSR
ncbi:DUF485 domain-containing protein [Streptomyces cirratus]